MVTDTEKAAQMKQQYLRSWRMILTHLLEWNERDTSRWLVAAEATWDLDSHNSWIFHESPFSWVVETIITQHLPNLSEDEYPAVEREILRVMDSPNQDMTTITDWEAERHQLKLILAPYRSSQRMATVPK